MHGQVTRKQQRFCEEYLIDLCAARAARRAGYSPRTAKEIGYQLLRRPLVAERIHVLMAACAGRGASGEKLRCVNDLSQIGETSPAAAPARSLSSKVPPKSAPRMRLQRERRREGAQLVTVELSRQGTQLLIKGGWLGAKERSDRDCVREAFIAMMLRAFELQSRDRL